MNYTRDELIAEVEHLLGTDSSENLARRLGYREPALSRRLIRAGRPDLARNFEDKKGRAA